MRNLRGTPDGTEGFSAIAIVDGTDVYFLSGKIHGAGWTRGSSRGIEDIGEVGNGPLWLILMFVCVDAVSGPRPSFSCFVGWTG